MDAAAGDPTSTRVVVKNQTGVDARFEVALVDMQRGSGSGASRAFEYVEVGTARRGAGAWITPSTGAFDLEGGSERSIELAVDVPTGTGPGGWYAAVQFVATPIGGAAGQFEFESVVYVPVLVTVDGEFERELGVSIAPERRVLLRGGRATWTVELRNDGDVHEVVNGRVVLDSAFTGASSAPLRPAVLLPGERRTQEVSFDLRSAPDAWRAEARIEREVGEPSTTRSDRTWVVPWWLLVLVAVVVAAARWRARVRSRDWD